MRQTFVPLLAKTAEQNVSWDEADQKIHDRHHYIKCKHLHTSIAGDCYLHPEGQNHNRPDQKKWSHSAWVPKTYRNHTKVLHWLLYYPLHQTLLTDWST